MKQPLRTLDLYCIIIGLIFLIQGIYNLINPPFLGLFTSNPLHAVFQTLLGIGGIWTGFMGGAYLFSLFLGIVLFTVGILYFIPPAQMLIVDLLNVNAPVAQQYIIFAVVSVLVAFLGKKLSGKLDVQ